MFWYNIMCNNDTIGLTSAATLPAFYRVKFLTLSLYVYTTISMVGAYSFGLDIPRKLGCPN